MYKYDNPSAIQEYDFRLFNHNPIVLVLKYINNTVHNLIMPSEY
jgi:hypothetical protein